MTIAEVMRPAPVALQPDLPIESAAHVLSQDEIREVPVVLGGELVGRLGRSDLIRVLAQEPDPVTEARTDADLVADMQDQLAQEEWVSNRTLWIDARNGVIALSGLVANEEERAALETMARAIAGCKGVEDHLIPRTAVRHVWA